MYKPPRYKKNDPHYCLRFIQENPFATFIIQGEYLLATHIPVLTEGGAEDFKLYAHIADHNEQRRFLKDGMEAMFIFQDAHSYVSSSWYKEKNISTWDYSAVHVNFRLTLQTKTELEESLKKLVHHFEKDQDSPMYFESLPKEMVKDHLQRITGFWCEPTRIQGVAKLHQNFDQDDIQNVVKHLKNEPNPMSGMVGENILKENDKNN
jgi:transcriptional regulator